MEEQQKKQGLKDGSFSKDFQYEKELHTGTKGKIVQVKHKIDRKKYAIKCHPGKRKCGCFESGAVSGTKYTYMYT